MQCFRHSELQSDRPSTEQFKEKLPWFLTALPSADCAKGGHGAYSNSVDLKGLWLVEFFPFKCMHEYYFYHCLAFQWYQQVDHVLVARL